MSARSSDVLGWLAAVRAEIWAADGEADSGGSSRDHQKILLRLLEPEESRLDQIDGLLADPDDARRVVAADAVAALAFVVRHGNKEGLLQRAAAAVRELVDRVAPAIAPLVSGDPSPRVRAAALRALIELRDPDSVPVIIARLHDADEDVQDLALAWAVAHGDQAAAPLLLRRLAEDLAESLIEDLPDAPDPTPRRRIWISTAEQVRALGIPQAAPLLLARLVTSTGPSYSAESAAEALIEHVTDDAVPALAAALEAGDHGSIYAAIALARRPAPAAAGALLARVARPATMSQAERLQNVVVHALAVIGDPALYPALLAHLDPPSDPLQVATLALIDDPAARLLARAAAERPGSMRRIAALVPGGHAVASPADLVWLRELLADADPHVRQNAALALAALDLDGLDEAVADSLAGRWYVFPDGFSGESLARAVVLEALARRLDARTSALSAAATRAIHDADGLLRAFDIAIEEGIRVYRGRAGGLGNGFVFQAADRIEEVRRLGWTLSGRVQRRRGP